MYKYNDTNVISKLILSCFIYFINIFKKPPLNLFTQNILSQKLKYFPRTPSSTSSKRSQTAPNFLFIFITRCNPPPLTSQGSQHFRILRQVFVSFWILIVRLFNERLCVDRRQLHVSIRRYRIRLASEQSKA